MSIKLGLTFLVLVTVSVGAGATVDISSVTVSAIKTNSVVISWDSTVAGTSQIEYGTTVSYGSITQEESLSYFHTTELSGLAEGTLYHFRIKSKEYGGVETISADYAFTTRTQSQLEAVIRAARQDGELSKTYYVKTDGNDANDGLSIATAWKSPSTAISRSDVGDTVYLLNGTWNKEPSIIFPRSGIDVASITLTAYNGTPTLDGVDSRIRAAINLNKKNYIIISNLKIMRYKGLIGFGEDGGNSIGSHIRISGCELSDTPFNNLSDAWGLLYISGSYSHYNTIENCTLYNSGWNNIQVFGNRNPPAGAGIPSTHITIRNNKIFNSNYHGGIDLFGNLDYVDIRGNEYYNSSQIGIGTHDNDIMKYMSISDNSFHDLAVGIDTGAIELGAQNVKVNYSIILNNTFRNITGYALYLENAYNQTIGYNNFYNVRSPRSNGGDSVLFDRNYIHTDAGDYAVVYNGKNVIIRNPLGKKTILIGQNIPKVTLEFSDGTVFTATPNPDYSVFTPIKYYPDGGRCAIEQTVGMSGGSINPVTTYPFTARPASESATVTVNKFDTTLTKGNILVDFTADTTNGNNVDFVIAELKADTNYQLTRAGVNYHVVKSNANKCIAFSNSEWSAKNFTIEETGLAPDIITDPSVNIDSDTRPPIITPYAPQSLSATVGDGEVNLSWQAPASDGGSPITGYKVYRSNASGLETFLAQIGTSLSYTDATVNNGVTYYYQVSAVNSAGEGAKSNEVIALPTSSSVGSGNLETIKVYPNPYIKGKSSTEKITFANLPKEAEIRIYTISGELVHTMEHKETLAGGREQWDISEVNSGVYLYMIDSAEGTKKGKVSVIK